MTTTRPPYGTVECFADILRPRVGSYIALPGCIQAIIDGPCDTAEEKVAYVRNALAAAELVQAELTAEAGR